MPLDVSTGARTRFTLAGVTIGLATRASVNDEINYQALEVLDNIEVLDHVPVGYMASLSASQFRAIGQTITALGFFPKKGQTPSAFLKNIITPENIIAQL